MSRKLELLDQALAMSETELGYLVDGEIEQAEKASIERAELIRLILSMENDDRPEKILSKLMQLRNLQSRMTGEAKKLHAQLKTDLARAKQETRRMSGYAGGSVRRSVGMSRFINKRG